MNLERIYIELRKLYPEANALDGKTNQNGLFIMLDKVEPISHQKDMIYFRLSLDCVSFNRTSQAIYSFLDELRERTIKAQNIFAEDIFDGISFIQIDDNGHYGYSLNLKITAYRDLPSEILEDE
ncbi:hypothetical protein [Campylobacter lanienae]|uniref:hypothetical protein n=1 Tax=Campylobacter lanienae TaxID=75658 RepID=UPI000BB44C4C|nr:hypothetical protein [Campylobacter lanienae]